jgi:hypothetical protein
LIRQITCDDENERVIIVIAVIAVTEGRERGATRIVVCNTVLALKAVLALKG